jgi:hypothetical protein
MMTASNVGWAERSDDPTPSSAHSLALGLRCRSTQPCLWGAFVLLLAGFSSLAVAQGTEWVFDIRIEKGKVAQTMRLVRVNQGDMVRLRWTSDRPIVLHLHGYDIERKVEPGAVAEMAFEARATGRFPVEEHKPGTKGSHAHGEAPLVRIEVRPR